MTTCAECSLLRESLRVAKIVRDDAREASARDLEARRQVAAERDGWRERCAELERVVELVVDDCECNGTQLGKPCAGYCPARC